MNQFQRTNEWHSQRVGKITASRVSGILGQNRYATRDDVMREMVRTHYGAEVEFTGNIATDWGNKWEPACLEQFELATGYFVVQSGLVQHPAVDYFACSPDGLIDDAAGVELKCPLQRDPKDVVNDEQYHSQVYFSMNVTGRKTWYLFAWHPDKGHAWEIFEWDKALAWWAENVGKLQVFHGQYLDTINDPAKFSVMLEPLVADMEDDQQWKGIAARYQRLKSERDKLDREIQQAKEGLLALAAGKKSRGAGVLVYPMSNAKGKVNWVIK